MTRILYIAGWGRSGTTLLDNLLGQVQGWVSVGELHYVWQRGLVEDRSCGCGKLVRDCDFWRDVFGKGFNGVDSVDPTRAIAALRAVRTRFVRKVSRMVRTGTILADCKYVSYLECLYDGIRATSGAGTIVDSSKFPVDAMVAASLPGYEVYVVHMVRDPRAVAFSWRRRKAVLDKSDGLLRRVGYVRSTLVWQLYNLVIGRYVKAAVGDSRYLRLPYERLAAEPESVLREITEFVGDPAATRPAFDGNSVEMAPTHTASGNPNRFRSGRTDIALDSEWCRSMPWLRRSAVTALSWPTLSLMGYRMRSDS